MLTLQKNQLDLTKAQILQQSAMAMIAQAGKAQQNVLQLTKINFLIKISLKLIDIN